MVFLIPLEVHGHSVPHWKALNSGKYEPRGLSCGSTLSIYQDFLKSSNLFHVVDPQMHTTVQNLHCIVDQQYALKGHGFIITCFNLDVDM